MSGSFCIIVIAVIAWYGIQYHFPEYLDAEEFVALKEQIKTDPLNTELIERIRTEDLTRRKNYFFSESKLKTGAWMLFCGLIIFSLSMRRYSALIK